jgi:hypothetical protein
MNDASKQHRGYASGRYWRKRSHLLYYQAVRQIVDELGTPGASILDVGSGNSPYLDWFDWAGERISVDIRVPYRSEKVHGLQADILTYDFDKMYDICMCLQVLEHIPDPTPFARRLFELGRVVVVSVPFKWPRGHVKGHLHDPVDHPKLQRWMGCRPDYQLVVTEPLQRRCSARLIGIYDPTGKNECVRTFSEPKTRSKLAGALRKFLERSRTL